MSVHFICNSFSLITELCHQQAREFIKVYFIYVYVRFEQRVFCSSCETLPSNMTSSKNGQFHLMQLCGFYCECYQKKKDCQGERWASVHILFRNVKDNSFCSK